MLITNLSLTYKSVFMLLILANAAGCQSRNHPATDESITTSDFSQNKQETDTLVVNQVAENIQQVDSKESLNNVSWQVFQSPDLSYGYQIMVKGQLIIDQPNIPGQPGSTGFKSKADAEKVAALVADKIKKNQMPPTVSIEELKQLNSIK